MINSKALTQTSNPIVIVVVVNSLKILSSPVSIKLIDRFNKIHRHKSFNVDTVKTIFENLVFIIPISKNILEITGIEVIAVDIAKTKPKEIELFAVPIKYCSNSFINIRLNDIGMIVAPKKSKK